MSEDPSIEAFLVVLSSAPSGPYQPIDKYRDFRHVFLGTDQGKRVLFELLRMSGVNKAFPPPGPVDAYRTHEFAGRRNLGLQVIGTLVNEPKEKPSEAKKT